MTPANKPKINLELFGAAPYSQEAEEAAIGAILVNPSAFDDCADIIKPQDFFLLRHNRIWQAFLRLIEAGTAIDYLTVSEELKTMGVLDDIGGYPYLIQLMTNTPTSVHATIYAGLVKATAFRRDMMTNCIEIMQLCMEEQDEKVNVQTIHQHALYLMDTVLPQEGETTVMGEQSLQEHYDYITMLMDSAQNGKLMYYPLPEAWMVFKERHLPFVTKGEMVVTMGAPGSGKSAFLMEWMDSLALVRQEHPEIGKIKYIHTEMNPQQINARRAARYSGVPYNALMSGEMTAQQQTKWVEHFKSMSWVNEIEYTHAADVEFHKLQTMMRRAFRRGVRIFFLDNFQDVTVTLRPGDNLTYILESAVKWLADFAEKNECLLVIASQENKDGKTKWTTKLQDKATTLIRIKRSRLASDYAYTFNNTVYTARAGQDNPLTDVFVDKARFGVKGKHQMLYHGQQYLWADRGAWKTGSASLRPPAPPIPFRGAKEDSDEDITIAT